MRFNPARKLTTPLLLLAIAPLVTNCAPGQPVAKPDFCSGWSAIRPEAADVNVISASLVRQIVTHNEHGVALRCWAR